MKQQLLQWCAVIGVAFVLLAIVAGIAWHIEAPKRQKNAIADAAYEVAAKHARQRQSEIDPTKYACLSRAWSIVEIQDEGYTHIVCEVGVKACAFPIDWSKLPPKVETIRYYVIDGIAIERP
jgi:hypothetical protein